MIGVCRPEQSPDCYRGRRDLLQRLELIKMRVC
jgi:hypothetical protein